MAQEDLSSSPLTPPKANTSSKLSSSGRDAQLDALLARYSTLESTLSQLLTQRNALVDVLSPPSETTEKEDSEMRAKVAVDVANARIKTQIKQLQEYNDIKDIGTQLMGLIAEKRGCRIGEVQEEFGINAED